MRISSAGACRMEYFNLSGQRIEKPAKGMFVEQTVMSDGTRTARVVRR